ncbi:MAG TPA: hypothetical protein VFH51_17335 [Myxococcota bacterium]|nr:hypothetical protein [Myxococcota bacterium]
MSSSISRYNTASSPAAAVGGNTPPSSRPRPAGVSHPDAAGTAHLDVPADERVAIGDAPFAPYGSNNGMGGGPSFALVGGLVAQFRGLFRRALGSGR